MAIIPSFVWPPEDPANLLAPFPSSSMNPSDPDGGLSGSYRHIKVNFTKGLPPFSPDHPTRRASGPSSVTQPSQSNDSVPQFTPPRPPKRRRPNPPDPAPILSSEDTIILASKSGATPCYCCVISCRDCPYCDYRCTCCIRPKQACFTAES